MSKRIAIPSNGEQLDAHFGRAQAFTVFEIEGHEARQVETLSALGLEHQHEGLASMFKRNGIEVLVCGGIGGGMIDSLNDAGLDLITGVSGNTVDVAQSYAMGTLVSTGSACQEHHHY
ncbi:MAG: NifB/NifX family molybdenum-iron cluster-binding protein [Desulfitobacteriaceae bacterium]|nr:NifB/NifX family molybdenum-iron cluster-binding protein [Desulfitobacteriaceae bacterium]MDI6879923.1 NifB/NifX family molybdenum-iron cluster-binding protein [Desulfitobacteriaceae bacterium]MDI6915445.1 NifB/NifX family molybdenum-iron cluster-binding protein [Desulfitobacteriaceae bacterium]